MHGRLSLWLILLLVLGTTFVDDIVVYVTPSGAANAPFVADYLLDGQASYVFSPTVGANDLYTVGSIGATPVAVFGTTTRAYAIKSDGGPRSLAVQLKSSGITVQSTPQLLNTLWGWFWRSDTVDPATGVAWTPAACAAVQIGSIITA